MYTSKAAAITRVEARLSGGYRVYYRVSSGALRVVRVEEVNKHEYKKIERLFGH